MAGKLDGQVAVVTGASRGIGLGIAQRLVTDGAQVCVTARREDTLAEAVATLGGKRHAIAVAGRADDVDHQSQTILQTLDAFGRVDLLVNNAGINPVYGPMIEKDLAAARKISEVNALAALSWTQQAYRAWMADNGGAVVNVSSVAGIKPAPGIGFYGASKAMLTHITQELAVELGPRIQVNGVAPAVVKTQYLDDLGGNLLANLDAAILRRSIRNLGQIFGERCLDVAVRDDLHQHIGSRRGHRRILRCIW